MTVHVLYPKRARLTPRELTFAERLARDTEWLQSIQDRAMCMRPDLLRRRARTAKRNALLFLETLQETEHGEAETLTLLAVAGHYATEARYYEAAAEAKS